MDIQYISKLLTTAQVSENFQIQTPNVIEACKKGRLTENEAVLTAVGWLIEPHGAARLWPKRVITIEIEVSKLLKGNFYPQNKFIDKVKDDVYEILSAERKKSCRFEDAENNFYIKFKDVTLIGYKSKDAENIFIKDICALKDITLLVSPRGLENEVYREVYQSRIEAQDRIDSFKDCDGWAKFENAIDEIS